MTSISENQLRLNFEPSLPERYPTLREYIAYRTLIGPKLGKTIAADMDMSPSMLSRKLSPSEGDTQRMNLDDFEGWLRSTGDAAAVVQYLAAKYMDSDETRKARAIGQAEKLLSELGPVLAALRAAG